jgi:hypothetical protein
MNKQPYIERMLENENLTDELEDPDANWLLDWGSSQMDTVLEGANDSETAGNRANALMAVMRKINRIAGSYADKSPQSLASDLAALYDLFQQAFGYIRPNVLEAPDAPSPVMAEDAALRLSALDTRQALEFLTRWYTDGISQ